MCVRNAWPRVHAGGFEVPNMLWKRAKTPVTAGSVTARRWNSEMTVSLGAEYAFEQDLNWALGRVLS